MVGLECDDLDLYEVENDCVSLEIPSLENIVPRKGVFLGLDISKNSTGIALIEDGEVVTGNIRLEDTQGVHKEVLLRRALKDDLRDLVEGKKFDLIIIEDAFVGENADTVRTLFALNTAIDELILDGVCSTEVFLRVPNQQWKSWLYSIDTDNITKGFNDKEKIRICLEMIGVSDSGEGYQDRLDAMGLVVSYFLKGKGLASEGKLTKKKKVRLSDVEASYSIESSYLFYGRDDVNRDNIVFIDYKKIGKTRMLELLTDNPDSVFVTSSYVLLGNLGVELGLDIIDGGGYFAFWIKSNKLKKYLSYNK